MESIPEAEVETFHTNLIQVTYTGHNGEVATEEVHGFGRQISDDIEEVEEYTPENPQLINLPVKNLQVDIGSSGENTSMDLNSNAQKCSLKLVNLVKEKDSLIIIPSNDEFLKSVENDNDTSGQISVQLENESEKHISSTSASSPYVEELPPVLVAYKNFPDDLCDSSQPHSNLSTPNHSNEDSDFNKESPPLLSPEVSGEPDTTIAQPTIDQETIVKTELLEKAKKPVRTPKETNCTFSVTPHSSAEIQERVKNRHRKKTLSYSIGSPEPEEEQAKKAKVEAPLASAKKKPQQRKPKKDSRAPAASNNYLEGLFIVEKIVKKSLVNNKLFFYVKWLNYPTCMNTWEPSGNFSPELIQYYENSLEETPAAEVLKCKKFQLTHCQPAVRKTKKKKNQTTSCQSATATETSDSMDLDQPETPVESQQSTFEDKRMMPTGFDKGYTFNKVVESFILDGVKCGLVQFVGIHKLELITFSIINEKVRSVLLN